MRAEHQNKLFLLVFGVFRITTLHYPDSQLQIFAMNAVFLLIYISYHRLQEDKNRGVWT